MGTPLEVITNPPDLQNIQMISARQLLESLEVKRSELREHRWEIIEQICKARDMMEQYEAGEIGAFGNLDVGNFARLTTLDGEALVFLNDYSNGSRLATNDSENEMPTQDGSRPGVSGEESDERFSDGADLTPSSSTQTSPADQSYADNHLQPSRLRGPGGTDRPDTRRLTGRKARSSVTSGRANSAMGQQYKQELPYRMPMGMHKLEEQLDGESLDTIMQDHKISGNQVLAGSGVMTRMPQQGPMHPFDGDLETHPGARDMMQILPNGPCHHGPSVQPWLGMMPDMGPEPPDHVFGIHPHLTTQPHELGHPYAYQCTREMGNRIEGVLPLMGTMHYHDFNSMNSDMMSQHGVNLNMTPGAFYGL